MRRLCGLVLLILAGVAALAADDSVMRPIKVEIVKTEQGYQLFRGDKPYAIKGAGLEYGDMASFAAHGGNSIRTWTTQNQVESAQEVLDRALAHGVTVALCLPMGTEHWGFDYDDEEAVAAQLERFRAEVLKYRDHPALLVWIIGNELNTNYTNSKVYDAVNDVAEMIQELDPNHPTTTTIAGVHNRERELADIKHRAPALDFVSFQVYGELAVLPDVIESSGFDQPFFVTEWGAIGYWEVEETTWGAPVELTSSQKARFYLDGYRNKLKPLEGQLLGSYVFLWGQKQERTPTWFGLFTDSGMETEVVDVMHKIWNGSWPDNRSPAVIAFELDGKSATDNVTLEEGGVYFANLTAKDPDGDPLRYRWEVKPESEVTAGGGVIEREIGSLTGAIAESNGAQATIRAPEAGNYRLFAYVYDDQGHAGHANIPFTVKAKAKRILPGKRMALSYSGFREGQHPDRGEGAVNPTDAEILEDLRILTDHGFDLIRLYDSGENSATTLRLIREHQLPIKVMLGIWLRAEISNHLGCAWLDEPIPDAELAANTLFNTAEIARGIALANEYQDVVAAVSVGNEALVDWTDHMVSNESVIRYVRRVKSAVMQPVTVAENYVWWRESGAALAAEVDFLGVHTYAVWEGKDIEQGLEYTIENIDGVRAAHPDKPLAVLEAGWATIASEFGERASEAKQARYYAEMLRWANDNEITVFFFEAFDEPWKGDPNNPLGAEKHWGLFNVDRTPKQVLRD
jgi:exo-beta-1,3-glucanase (GH17 family)